MKRRLGLLLTIMSVLCMGCNGNANPNAILKSAKFTNVKECEDVSSFIGDVVYNSATEYGVITSPYFIMQINDENIPVYAARSANGLHSFAYAFVNAKDSKDPFHLNIKITAKIDCDVIEDKNTPVDVLPLSHNVKATLDFNSRTISATVSDYGSFSFIFNKTYMQPLTLIVTPIEDTSSLFAGKEIEYLLPGDYSNDINVFNFTNENKVYYFKQGYYKTSTIGVPNNSIVYFEPGTYIQILPGGYARGLHNNGNTNLKILGHGLVDYSQTLGGENVTHDKSGNIFEDVKGLEITGVTIVNSNTWTLCCYNCDDVHIQDVSMFSYRVFSDGVMLSGCVNGLVERNFLRTGDDGLEVKAAGAKRLSQNILFQYNDVWTDKANAYGCIYETKQDISNVSFQHNTVGFALSNWSEHLGCVSFSLGDNKDDPKTIHDIKVNDLEVFCSYNPAIINFYYDGRSTYRGYGHMKDIYISNVNVEINKNPINTYLSFINHLPEAGGDVSKIGTFENIVVSNIKLVGTTLSMLNKDTAGFINTKFYEGQGYTKPELDDFLFIRNGNTYE